MDPKLGFIFVIIVASNQIFFVSGIDMKLGTFHNLHQHTELKSCADEVLKQNLCVGGRVQELTGDCECLSSSWGINQTIQAGYAYTKKVSVEEIFRPPVNFKERKAVGWILPGVLREGAKIELTIASDAVLGSISLLDTLDEIVEWFDSSHNFVQISYSHLNSRAQVGNFGEQVRGQFLQNDDTFFQLNVTKAPKTKISLLALSDSLWVLVADQTIFWKNITLDLTAVRQIVAKPFTDVTNSTLIHSFKFIDA